MLNVHFDGVFRKVEPCRNQLVGKTQFQSFEHLPLTGRKVGSQSFGHGPCVTVPVADRGPFGKGCCRRKRRRFILADPWQRSIHPTGKYEAQTGDGDLDWN